MSIYHQTSSPGQWLTLISLLLFGGCWLNAASIQWTNTSGGHWSVATNWSPAQVPGPLDTAAISASGTYTVTLDADASIAGLAVGGASGTQTFAVNVNVLTLNGASVVSSNGRFQLSGGTLEGTNTLAGTMSWTGGTIGSNAVVTVGSNAVLAVTGSSSKTLAGTLRNSGTVLWQSPGVYGRDAYGYLAVGPGMIHNLPDGDLDLQTDSVFVGAVEGAALVNEGVLRKSGGTGIFTVGAGWGMVLTNRGSVDVQTGKLELQGGGFGSGSFNVATNAEVVFASGYTGTVGTVLRGCGWYGFKGGASMFAGELSVACVWVSGYSTKLEGSLTVRDRMSLDDGTWLGANRVEGTMGWTGGTIGSNAVVTVRSNAVLAVTGSSSKTLAGTLRNSGTVLWQSPGVYGRDAYGYLAVGPGMIHNLPDGDLDLQTDSVFVGAVEGAALVNEGVLRKSGGTGIFTVGAGWGMVLTNRGSVDVQSGTLQLLSGMESSSSSTLGFGLRGVTDFGRITLPGPITFTGRLCATLLDGFVPAANDSFSVMTFASRTGDFTDTSCLDLDHGIRLVPEFTPTSLRLVMTNATPAPGILQFSQTQWSVAESAGTATIAATRIGGSLGPVSVSFAVDGGTATAGADYTIVPVTLLWADGETGNKTFTITILDDVLSEGNETISLSLSNPTGGASLGALSHATLTIVDDESAIASTFDSNADGWAVVDLPATPSGPFTDIIAGPYTPVFSATGGNPGGYIYFQDPSGNAFYFQAPARYLGSQSAAYGANLTYDQHVISTNNTLRDIPDVILVSGSNVLVYQASSNPGPSWTSFSVPLLESGGWRVGSFSGPVPTEAEFQAVLASLTALRIRGEYSPTPFEEIVALDNVILHLGLNTATEGLLAHWRFDESGGTIAHDSVGGYHGTLSPTGARFVTNGISGNALELLRTNNGFVSMGNILGFTNGPFTIQAWIKLNPGETQAETVVAKHQSAEYSGYFLDATRTGGMGDPGEALFYTATAGTPRWVTSTEYINDGGWHQLVGVCREDHSLGIYVDGAPIEASRSGGPIASNDADFMIGAVFYDSTPQGLFSGLIDEVQVYDWTLSDEEIQYLFENPGQTVFPFRLNIRSLGDGNIALWWDSAPGAFAAQYSRSLSAPEWQDVIGSAQTNFLALPTSGHAAFFRLKRIGSP
jgi:hypothetical protein